MSYCVILDGGYHGEKLYDTEYRSCHESGCQAEPYPFQNELLELIRQIGRLLKEQGNQVYYTRCGLEMVEEYPDCMLSSSGRSQSVTTPSKVAELANDCLCSNDTENPARHSCLLSFHRTLLLYPGQTKNAEIFIYRRNTAASRLAFSIMRELETEGFHNLGIRERPNLTILRRTKIPALFITLGNLPLASEKSEENDMLIQSTAEAFVRGIIGT